MKFRPVKRVDLPFINRVRNQYAKEYLHDPRTFSINQTIDWWEGLPSSSSYYIIENEKEQLGYFRLTNHNPRHHRIYIGMDLDTPYLGKGIGYLAYLFFLPYVFNRYGVNKVSLEVLSTNERAFRFYKTLGFVVEGTKREEVYKDGKYVDSIMMSILKMEYELKYGKVCEGIEPLSRGSEAFPE